MVDQFLNYLRYERNRSMLTVERYAKSLREFEEFFTQEDREITWATVDSDIIRGWMESLVDKGHKATSVNADLAAIRSFYRFALSRHFVDRDPAHLVTGPKKQKPLPQFVKESEMDQLLDKEEWGSNYNTMVTRSM